MSRVEEETKDPDAGNRMTVILEEEDESRNTELGS